MNFCIMKRLLLNKDHAKHFENYLSLSTIVFLHFFQFDIIIKVRKMLKDALALEPFPFFFFFADSENVEFRSLHICEHQI